MKADGIFHRAQLLGLVCIACSLWGAERCQAHPASHVDAWARIGTHLEIRVTVFLDSVLEVRSDAEQSDVEPTLVSAEAARQALLRFDETLQQQLTIWDETGRQLLPRIQRRPRWTPPDRGVDLQAVSSLRLTWQLRYPWRPSQQSFSVSHSFVKHQQPGLEAAIPERTPCELRLRVRSDVSGRRIDTIITDHLRHTIVLPQSTSHNVTPSVSSVPAARLVVLPTQLIHEFTIPESQVPAAFTLFESAADTLSVKDNARLRRQVEPWVRQNCQVTADGIELSPTAITTELLTAQDERFSNGAFSDASSASGEIRVGIRTVHPLRISPDRISVTWKSMTQSIADVQLDTLRGHISTSQLIDRNDSAPDELTHGRCCDRFSGGG